MRLGIRILNNASGVNNLQYMNQAIITPGSTTIVYFQLVDLDQQQGSCAPPRYLPFNSGATVQINIHNINVNNIINKIATKPFATDGSVWAFSLTSLETQNIGSTVLTVTLTDGSSVQIANASQAIITNPNNIYGC